MNLVARTAVFVAIAPGAIVVLVPWAMISLSGASADRTWALAGGSVAMAAGLALFAWCVADFIARGHGTPDPNRPPTELVVRGPFSVVRNPMYVAIVTIIAGEALLFRSPWLLAWGALVLAAFHARVVIYEEPTLARDFTESWDAYRSRVPRWLPRMKR